MNTQSYHDCTYLNFIGKLNIHDNSVFFVINNKVHKFKNIRVAILYLNMLFI